MYDNFCEQNSFIEVMNDKNAATFTFLAVSQLSGEWFEKTTPNIVYLFPYECMVRI